MQLLQLISHLIVIELYFVAVASLERLRCLGTAGQCGIHIRLAFFEAVHTHRERHVQLQLLVNFPGKPVFNLVQALF